jgi:hypothetical protein
MLLILSLASRGTTSTDFSTDLLLETAAMMKHVTNTAKDERHPEWVMGGNPNAIVAQEKRGQDQLVNSTQLPTDMRDDSQKILEAAGVVFGELTPGDELFREATLPAGWKKEATKDPMHIKLLDANGHLRATIFYKAAFYDRVAFLGVCTRFNVDRYGHDQKYPGKFAASVLDAKGEVEFKTKVQELGKGENEWDVRDRVSAIAENWLNENYPAWKSPAAYWD